MARTGEGMCIHPHRAAGSAAEKFKKRKEVTELNVLNRKLSKKSGFTLVEMLIVVAIIAILIAVSIPLVSQALEKARDATDRPTSAPPRRRRCCCIWGLPVIPLSITA